MKNEWLEGAIRVATSRRFIYAGLLIAMIVPSFFSPVATSLDSGTIDLEDFLALTFVSCPPPAMSQSDYALYKVSVWSWLAVNKHSKVVLFVDPSFDKRKELLSFFSANFGPNRLIYVRTIQKSATGAPLVSDVLKLGTQMARTRFACFIESNVVVDVFWYNRVMSILKVFDGSGVYITGSAIDIAKMNITGPDNFDVLEQKFNERASCKKQVAGSYFVVPIDPLPFSLSEFPEMWVGGLFWELHMNWLANSKTSTVDLVLDVPVYRLETAKVGNWESRVYHNAKLVKRLGLGLAPNHELKGRIEGKNVVVSGTESFLDGLKDLQPLVSAPDCVGEDKLPHVIL